MHSTSFNRYPKMTLTITMLVLASLSLLALNWVAGHFFGLGKVVLYEANPIYGYRVAPNQSVARNAYQRIHVNNLGMRAKADWDLSSNKPKILFIGDSVTYGGSYIDNDNLFSEKIGHALPQYQVGNAAVNGWGVDNVVAFIKDTGFLAADIYVLVFPEGDFYRGLSRIGGQPFWTRKPAFALEELLHYGIYKAHLVKTPHLHAYENSVTEKTQIAQLAVEHLSELITFLEQHHKKVMVVISPSLPQVLGKAQRDPIVQRLLHEKGIPAIYLLDRILSSTENTTNAEHTANTHSAERDKASLFHDTIHLSNQGHELWAALMLPDIKD